MEARPGSRPYPWLALICLIGLGLRLQGLGEHDLWNNELFSAYWIRNGFSFLWHRGFAVETNPPLYYSLLKLWAGWFGDGDAALRLPSTIASMACLPLAYAAGAALAGPGAGLWAAALMAVAPNQVQMAQSARCYALLSALATALIALLALVVRDEPDRPRWPCGRLLALAGAVPVGLAMAYTHATGAIVVAALNAPALLLLARKRRWRLAAELAAANTLIAAGALACLLRMLTQAGSPNLAHIAATTPLGWLCHLTIVIAGLQLAPWFVVPVIGGMALLTGAAWRCRPGAAAIALLEQPPLLFLAAIMMLDRARPVMQFQILAWLAVPACLLGGVLLARGARLAAPFALTMAVISAVAIPGHRVGMVEDWRGLVRQLPAPAAGAVVAVGPLTSPLGLIRYDAARPLRMLSNPGATTAQHMLAWRMGVSPISPEQLAGAIRQGRQVVLVLEALDADRGLGVELARLPPPRRGDLGNLRLLFWNSPGEPTVHPGAAGNAL